jgi:hypothetical protein
MQRGLRTSAPEAKLYIDTSTENRIVSAKTEA